MKKFSSVIALLLSLILILGGCGTDNVTPDSSFEVTQNESIDYEEPNAEVPEEQEEITQPEQQVSEFNMSGIPEYNGKAYTVVNNNIPYFTDDDFRKCGI